MAESVKDLVVRLSFEHGDTKSQIAAIKNEIKLLDSGFEAAAQAAGGLSAGLNGAGRQSELLRQKISLQQAATEKYGKAIEEANQRLRDAQKRYADYAQKLEAARKKQAELTQSISGQKEALREMKEAGLEGTSVYAEAEAQLEAMKQELEQTNQQVRQWEQAMKRADSSIASADKSVQKLTTAQNASRAATARMQRELDGLNDKAELHRQRLESASQAMKKYAERAKEAGDRQVAAGRALSKGSALVAAAGATAAGTAISWEDSFAGVQKTVSGTAEQLAEIEAALLEMSTVKPAENTVLSEIAANAGQLGIATENIVDFTGVMADLAETTNLTAEEGASSFAKFANVTRMSQKDFDRLGSTVVELGNNLATTESDIVAMGTNLASAGTQIGLTQAEIMGIGAALSSLGLEAQAGGTAFSRLFVDLQVAAETGSEALEKYASVAGMTADEFARAYSQDAAGAIVRFIDGLSQGSQSAIVILDELGISETRFRDALLRTSNASELLTGAIDMANGAWEENTALTAEASVRYDTTASRLKMAGNRAKAAAINFGKDLIPAIRDGVDWVAEMLEKFNALDEGQRRQIMTWAAYAAAVGPAISILGKLNQGAASVASGLSKLTSAAAGAGGGLGGVAAAVKALLGPAGVAALAVGLGAGAYKFIEWATGARAAAEAAQELTDAAERMRETQAQTIYDTGSADPLARFGLSAESFAGAAQEAESWLDALKRVWSDGEKETDEIVGQFAEGFAAASDGVREKIEARGGLLEGLGALDDGTRAQMDADLKQLEDWDAEVTQLLKKRQNGALSAEDQARLSEVIELRAELSLAYGGEGADGFEGVLQGMRAEIDRTLSSGGEVELSTYGDALNALAQGRQSYLDSLNASYDAQHAEIMAIEDEATRTQALAALNDQYNRQRLEGEQAYQQAVQEAASAAFEAGGYEEQIRQIDELAALLGSGADLTALADWTGEIDEGKMASMLALVEQLRASGMEESALAELGVDADDLLGKIQQIREIAGGIEGAEGLASIFGEALPEEVQRVLIGLDMTQAAADWAAFMEDKNPLTVDAETSVRLNPLDEAAIGAWEAANAGVELTGPAAKVGVALGANWQAELRSALDAGLLSVTDAEGNKIEITPEVLEKIGPSDVAMVAEDGTVHVIVTAKVGSAEGVEASGEAMEQRAIPLLGSSAAEDVERVTNALENLAFARERLAQAQANGGYSDDGLGLGELGNMETAALEDLTRVLGDLSGADLEAIGGRIANLSAALAEGGLEGEAAEQAAQELQGYLDVVSAADQYLGTGNQVSAGIAEGMKSYGWAGDAGTLAEAIRQAIDAALGVASPAASMIPTGGYVAAGVGQGMRQYSFASDAGAMAQSLTGAFSGLPAQGTAIGASFGAGLQRGLQSRMRSTLALAKSYAAQITAAFRSAWQIHSPSRVAEGLTDMFGRGLEEGMKHWPSVSERLLENDLAAVRRAAPQTINTTNDSRDYSAHSSIVVERMEVRSEDDVQQLSAELAAQVRRQQWMRGS